MTIEPKKPDEQDIEKLVEAQARGETIEDIETEEEISADALLDKRISKGAFTFADLNSSMNPPHECAGVV